MKTLIHNQFCKEHYYDFLFNNQLSRANPKVDDDRIIIFDKKYDCVFLRLDPLINELSNWMEEDRLYELIDFEDTEKYYLTYYNWKEIRGK